MERARACPPPHQGKPSFWWAREKEPWQRVSYDITFKDHGVGRALFRIVQASPCPEVDAPPIAGPDATEVPPIGDWE